MQTTEVRSISALHLGHCRLVDVWFSGFMRDGMEGFAVLPDGVPGVDVRAAKESVERCGITTCDEHSGQVNDSPTTLLGAQRLVWHCSQWNEIVGCGTRIDCLQLLQETVCSVPAAVMAREQVQIGHLKSISDTKTPRITLIYEHALPRKRCNYD